jgi:hypothetical protein
MGGLQGSFHERELFMFETYNKGTRIDAICVVSRWWVGPANWIEDDQDVSVLLANNSRSATAI